MSAGAYAKFDKPTAHAGVRPPAHVMEFRSAIRAGKFSAELLGMWARLDMTMRIVVVMIGCSQPGKPEDIAHQPWDSFSTSDQVEMASAARKMLSALAEFAAVA